VLPPLGLESCVGSKSIVFASFDALYHHRRRSPEHSPATDVAGGTVEFDMVSVRVAFDPVNGPTGK
jgi:hypothetical protein